MGGQGALAGTEGSAASLPILDDALAAGQLITICSFQAVRAREASDISPATVPLHLHLHY
jgi:hypothetical protein